MLIITILTFIQSAILLCIIAMNSPLTRIPAFLFAFHGWLSTEHSESCFQDLSHITSQFCYKCPVAFSLAWSKSQALPLVCRGRPSLVPVSFLSTSSPLYPVFPLLQVPGPLFSMNMPKSMSRSRHLLLLFFHSSKTSPVFPNAVTLFQSCFYSKISSQRRLCLSTLPEAVPPPTSQPTHPWLPIIPILL